MSANRIYLVCSHCRGPEHALLLAERPDGESQYTAASSKRHDDWYAKHQRCGHGSDHYQIAYQRPLDWDVPKLATKAASGVRLALATNGSDNDGYGGREELRRDINGGNGSDA